MKLKSGDAAAVTQFMDDLSLEYDSLKQIKSSVDDMKDSILLKLEKNEIFALDFFEKENNFFSSDESIQLKDAEQFVYAGK